MNPLFPADSAPIKLYTLAVSGHAHRAELMLSMLQIPYEKIDVNLMAGEHKSAEFVKLNPFGQIPMIDDNGQLVSDSTAILVYLAKKYGGNYAWLPEDALDAAHVQRWLSVASGEVFQGPNAARLNKLFNLPLDYDVARAKTDNLFAILEPLLADQDFLAGNAITIADVACYTYIAHVPEGGISLEPYPAITAWLSRIESHPGFVGMVRSPEPA